jgi:hypothetical protein
MFIYTIYKDLLLDQYNWDSGIFPNDKEMKLRNKQVKNGLAEIVENDVFENRYKNVETNNIRRKDR